MMHATGSELPIDVPAENAKVSGAGVFFVTLSVKFIRLAVAATAALLVAGTVNAATVVLDGDLADLIVASGNIATGAQSSEPGNDAEINGYDITNMYSYFSETEDAFYLGFETFGTIGDACTNFSCFFDFGGLAFDSDETVGFQMKFGNTDFNLAGAIVVQQILTGDGIMNNGPGNEINAVQTVPGSVTVNWAVSEANDGVEFAIFGLISNGMLSPLSLSNPQDFAIRFSAGSADNPGPEDEAFLSGTLVPVPAAVWLFGSALLVFAGLHRRKPNYSHS